MQETMRDPAIERLVKIISDKRPGGDTGNDKNTQPRKPILRLHIGMDEGWFSLFLLATVVYSTIWCVQAADWVDHLSILSLTTLLGLIGGVVAAKQRRFPRLAVHLSAIILGLLLAFWQTAGAFYNGNTLGLAHGMQSWFVSVMAGGTGEDNSIFLFFITALGFLLAYTSAWLLYRTRSPWLLIVANAVVLLINLSNIESGYVVFLIVFLMASLLLLLRFNLYESIKRWRRQGLRYADDLGWDVMQAGALISIGILIFSWFLPWGYTNDTLSQIWNANANPLVQLEDTWNRVISVSGGSNPSNHGSFRDTLVLGGNPNLNNIVVFTVVTTDGTNQYLEAENFDTYDALHSRWFNGQITGTSMQTNEPSVPETSSWHSVVEHIHVADPPDEQDQYLFGPSQIGQVNQPSMVLNSNATGSSVAVLAKNGKLVAGEDYTVTSYVSSADENTLRAVPMPADSPPLPPNFSGLPPPNYYDPSIVATYTQLPAGLDRRIAGKAQSLTQDKQDPYEKAAAIEAYLKNSGNFKYDTNIQLPPDTEGASWLLFTSHRGFCTYFATAMTVMLRSLGIPARVASGYTNGQYDTKTHRWVVRGVDAHSWTQVYLAGYGWINFEPSPGFSSFDRPVPNQFPSGTTPPGSIGPGSPSNPHKPLVKNNESTGSSGPLSTQPGQEGALWGQRAGLAFGSIILLLLFSLILFTIWWRRLFRNYALPSQIYGRICLLANWAGIPIRRSQTPYEYINGLAAAAPTEAETLERFGDIYVRELWADPASPEHPRFTGEVRELPNLWQRLQPHLFLYVVRHPYVLRKLPARLWDFLSSLRTHRRARYDFEEDL